MPGYACPMFANVSLNCMKYPAYKRIGRFLPGLLTFVHEGGAGAVVRSIMVSRGSSTAGFYRKGLPFPGTERFR